ncbi:MAG: hypothetical protein IJU16_02040 [Clostridia bacterium]|nr:hypothetical protein [Clostridia bacterium]
MADQSYSVDDILLEYELRKKEEAAAAPRPKTATETFAAPQIATQPATSPPATPKKAEPERTVDRIARTRTRVLSVDGRGTRQQTREIVDEDEQIAGQLTFDQFDGSARDESEIEERVARVRSEKVRDFTLIRGGGFGMRLTGEEEGEDESETEEPDDEIEEEETEFDDEIDDFRDYEEAEAIRSELTYRRHTGVIGVTATAVGAFLLLAMLTATYVGLPDAVAPALLLSLQLVLLLGMMGINHRMMGEGWKRFFTMHSDADTVAPVLASAAALYTVWAIFWSEALVVSGLAVGAAGGVGLLAGAFGRQVRLVRICRNFAFTASRTAIKYAGGYVEDERTAREVARGVASEDTPAVVYFHHTPFLTRFLENSYRADPADRMMQWFVPVTAAVALLCAIGYALLSPDKAIPYAPTVFAATLAMALPVWTLPVMQRPISRAAKRSLRSGAMLVGWPTAEEFGDHPQALIVDAADLFPAEQVKLHGIKTFSGTRIDEAITDAAAVVIEAGGPLSPIFHRVIEERTDFLKDVESLAYEQDMGLSGWVGGKRVLVGNRRLLQNHGVEVPEKSYEERYTKDGRCAVYLSTGGELSAMFVVSYLAEPGIAARLRALQKENVQLLIRTCDPDVTAARVCEVMRLPDGAVTVLTAGEGRTYEGLLTAEKETPEEALIASGGRASGKINVLLQSIRLRRGAKAAVISQVIGGSLAMAFSVFVTVTAGVVLMPPVLLGWVLLVGAIGFLVPRFFKV